MGRRCPLQEAQNSRRSRTDLDKLRWFPLASKARCHPSLSLLSVLIQRCIHLPVLHRHPYSLSRYHQQPSNLPTSEPRRSRLPSHLPLMALSFLQFLSQRLERHRSRPQHHRKVAISRLQSPPLLPHQRVQPQLLLLLLAQLRHLLFPSLQWRHSPKMQTWSPWTKMRRSSLVVGTLLRTPPPLFQPRARPSPLSLLPSPPQVQQILLYRLSRLPIPSRN